jgi:hypothetical protein
VSARLLRAFRIWLAATEVEVFSKALSSLISSASFGRLGFATAGGGEGITSGERFLGGRRVAKYRMLMKGCFDNGLEFKSVWEIGQDKVDLIVWGSSGN